MTIENLVTHGAREHAILVRRFELAVVEGPDRDARVVSEDDELTVGSAAGASLRLTDPAVSRHHCAVRASERGLEIRDLGSTNGTFLGPHEIVRAFIRSGTRIRIGGTTLVATVLDDSIVQPLASADQFGALRGASPAMRRLYPLIEQYARSESTILLEGETGTGKELVAEAIHAASARRDGPLTVVDCSALPRQLAESELFGHARGSFTGAGVDRAGAFELASGGTVFLDEIGELPLELQPLLLRALEARTVRRIGTNQHRPIDVRVIAASHRDLRVEVNARRFRSDLFFRLNVLRLVIPPLRARGGDIALLAAHFWQLYRPGETIPAELVRELAAQAWPGNVRELRNTVERSALVGWTQSEEPVAISYGQAKDRAMRAWERTWLEQLLAAHDHNVSRAARAAQMARSHLRELVQRYGLGERDSNGDSGTD